jgi:3',5'-nucleoside bisphosphate phosphatase
LIVYVSTDLHGHTFYSDARATPSEYVRFRHGLGMKVIAISDHDIFAGVRAAAETAQALGMLVVPAAEVTSMLHFGTSEREQVHVLAYFRPDVLEDDRLERTFLYRRGLAVQTRWRVFVLEWMAAQAPPDRAVLTMSGALERVGEDSFPALQAVLDFVAARRPHLADGFRKHHARFWDDDRELFGWTPEDMIDAIRADGAVDVVAHPVRYKDRERLDRILAYATGVEVYTSRHNEKVAAKFRAYAEEHRKLWTASSDDHQRGNYMRPPSGTPLPTIERIFGRPVADELLMADPSGLVAISEAA